MHTTNYLAGCSKGSFKNNAIEHSGKSMKPRHIPAKICQGDDGADIVQGTIIHQSDAGCTCVSGDMYYYMEHVEIEKNPQTSNFSGISTVF